MKYNLNPQLKWVWLDLDDTLIDFHANSRAALGIIYRECDLDRFFPTPEAWIECYERHNHELWDRYSRQEITQEFLRLDRFLTPLRAAVANQATANLNTASQTDHGPEEGLAGEGKLPGEEELIALSRKLDPLYLDTLALQKVLVPGAIELLDRLREHKYNIGVLSNGFTSVQHAKLTNTGLASKVDLMVLSDDIGINKPDTRLYRHAMERAGDTDPRHHLMIGDNPDTDIRGALDSGWDAILLDRTGKAAPEWAETHLVTPSLYPLIELF